MVVSESESLSSDSIKDSIDKAVHDGRDSLSLGMLCVSNGIADDIFQEHFQ